MLVSPGEEAIVRVESQKVLHLRGFSAVIYGCQWVTYEGVGGPKPSAPIGCSPMRPRTGSASAGKETGNPSWAACDGPARVLGFGLAVPPQRSVPPGRADLPANPASRSGQCRCVDVSWQAPKQPRPV